MNALASPLVEPLSAEEVTDRASALIADLRGRAAETERLGRLPAANVEALQQAGLFKLLQPRRHGGLQMDLRTQVDAVAAIAREPATVVRITRQLFLKMLEGYPDAARRMRDAVAARVNQTAGEFSRVRGVLAGGPSRK